MQATDAIIIGAGQAGLAMSHCLDQRGISHVVLDRGCIGERWRSERWESLRLLTPNWMTRLPGWSYQGPEPDGYMTKAEVVRYLEDYAGAFTAPVERGVTVRALEQTPLDYRVETDRGVRTARVVVIATGHCDVPIVPAIAAGLPADILQITPSAYRTPDRLPDASVLVVGASASGVQLAQELQRSGRQVTLCVGRHTRLPRRYRGRDIMWWMDRIGVLDERADQVPDIVRARAQPSLQLVGSSDGHDIDLATLRDEGVRVVGRASAIDGHVVRLADDLEEKVATAQGRMARLLARIDARADSSDPPGEMPRPIVLEPSPGTLDLRAAKIGTVVWAAGFQRDYSWLRVPVLDAASEIVHSGGITPAPGLYALGLRFQCRRKSSFVDGVGPDAEELADHITRHLSRHCRIAA